MKRTAIFAHFDIHNRIEDYVVYYLEKLKEITDKIIFVSDCTPDEKELEKIAPYIYKSILISHGEYDFGSYKLGYEALLKDGVLDETDELIFANDSCYAPLYPFSEMFAEMEKKNVDFWGVTANTKGINIEKNKIEPDYVYHIQSYFMVFNKNVFLSESFKSFINSIQEEENKSFVILKYEIGLTKQLGENGFKYAVYCPLSEKHPDSHIVNYKRLVRKNRCPFLKRSVILCRNIDLVYPTFIKSLIKQTNFDYKYIENDFKMHGHKVGCKELMQIIKAFRRCFIRIDFKHKILKFRGREYRF